MSRFVLVHGGPIGGWSFEKLIPLLEAAGHEVEAPDLPGRGDDRTPIAEVSLQGYADRVSQVLDAHPEPVVLVGQSSGGAVISQVAEQRPDKVEMLVYVGEVLLRNGESLLSASENDTEALVVPNLVMSEDQTYVTFPEEIIKEALGADCSDEDVERAKPRFVPEAVAPVATPVAITEAFGRVPRVYIETLQDRAMSPSLQKEMYERMPCQKVISMDTSHWPFYAAPEELAGHLTSLPTRDSGA